MSTRDFRLLDFQEIEDKKIKGKSIKALLSPVTFIQKDLDIPENHVEKWVFRFLNTPEVRNFFLINPKEIKTLDLKDFSKSYFEFIGLDEVEGYAHRDYAELKKKVFIEERKNNDKTYESKRVSVKINFQKFFNVISINSPEIVLVGTTNPAKEDVEYAFKEAILEKLGVNYSKSPFTSQEFNLKKNGRFEAIVYYELPKVGIRVPLPEIIKNEGFSKREIFLTSIKFLEKYFQIEFDERYKEDILKNICEEDLPF